MATMLATLHPVDCLQRAIGTDVHDVGVAVTDRVRRRPFIPVRAMTLSATVAQHPINKRTLRERGSGYH